MISQIIQITKKTVKCVVIPSIPYGREQINISGFPLSRE